MATVPLSRRMPESDLSSLLGGTRNREVLMNRNMALAVAAPLLSLLSTAPARPPQPDGDIRLNVVVGSTGNLRNDGKGAYHTGEDYVAAWLNPTRWPEMSFDICMGWPFAKHP